MKSMHIAASCELVTRLSTHRRVVALDSTDFTDVAAVVISAADSRSGILTLLRRSGFNLPVYLLSETAVDKPEGVQAVIAGKDQEWLELEAAACDYEARLLPPFFNTLTQYVEMDNSTFACPGHQHGAFFKSTLQAVSSMTFWRKCLSRRHVQRRCEIRRSADPRRIGQARAEVRCEGVQRG